MLAWSILALCLYPSTLFTSVDFYVLRIPFLGNKVAKNPLSLRQG